MKRMTADADFANLKRERVWRELEGALAEPQPWRFFEVLHRCGAWRVLLPALAASLGDEKGHGGEPPPAILALQRAAAAEASPEVRLAALFGGLPGDPVAMVEGLRAPRAFVELTGSVVRHGAAFQEAAKGDPEGLYTLLRELRAAQRPERFADFLAAAGAIWQQPAAAAGANLRRALAAISTVSSEALQAQGVQGRALGEALRSASLAAIAAALGGDR